MSTYVELQDGKKMREESLLLDYFSEAKEFNASFLLGDLGPSRRSFVVHSNVECQAQFVMS